MRTTLDPFRYGTVSYLKSHGKPCRGFTWTGHGFGRGPGAGAARGATMEAIRGRRQGASRRHEGAVAMTQPTELSAAQKTSSDQSAQKSTVLYGGKGSRRGTVRDLGLAQERGENGDRKSVV